MASIADDDIKTECIEIVEEVDESVVSSMDIVESETAAGSAMSTTMRPFIFERNEREIVMRFIDLVRACPEVWDLTSAAYREKILRRRSFRKIGEQLGWSYDEVVKKYNNLRTYYTKEVIKVRKNANYVSRWPYFDQLDSFLRRTVHIRQQKHRQQNKWSRILTNRTSDRLVNYNGSQLAGLRIKRQTGSSHSARQRVGNFQNRILESNTSASTLTAPTSSLSSDSHSSVPGSGIVPVVNISHIVTSTSMPQVRAQQIARQITPQSAGQQIRLQTQRRLAPKPTPQTQTQSTQQLQPHIQQQSDVHRNQQQQKQQHQQQKQQQQQQKQQQLQQKREQQNIAVALTPQAQITRTGMKEQEPRLLPLSTPSSSLSLTSPSLSVTSPEELENSDTIFGKLIASQLSKIKEGHPKEQLKIRLMQHIVQAMFSEVKSCELQDQVVDG